MGEIDLSAMDPQARRFLAMVAVGAAPDIATDIVPDAGKRRASFERLMRFSRPPAAEIVATDLQIVGRHTIAARCYAPADLGAPSPGLVYFHGGGLVAGGLETHDALCRTLAHEARVRVVAVDYRLAPEHPFPAAIVDALGATRWVLRRADELGIASDRVAVGGDSGGGTLAAVVGQVLSQIAPRALRAQVLLCPALDFAAESASRRRLAAGFLIDAATIAADLVHYAPQRPLEDRRISPLRARDLAGLPATVLHTAGFDPLVDEGAAYARLLAEAGVEVRYRCHEALVHHFYGLDGVVPAARAALAEIGRDIAEVLA